MGIILLGAKPLEYCFLMILPLIKSHLKYFNNLLLYYYDYNKYNKNIILNIIYKIFKTNFKIIKYYKYHKYYKYY
jgi:hypothetical protein